MMIWIVLLISIQEFRDRYIKRLNDGKAGALYCTATFHKLCVMNDFIKTLANIPRSPVLHQVPRNWDRQIGLIFCL